MRHVHFAAGLEALTGRVVLGGDLQPRHELGGLLVDARVAGHHHLAKLLDVRVRRPGLGHFAGIDIDLIRRHHDRGDLRIGDTLRQCRRTGHCKTCGYRQRRQLHLDSPPP